MARENVWCIDSSTSLFLQDIDCTYTNVTTTVLLAAITFFADFWQKRGFTIEEGVALMGSHSLVDEQVCWAHVVAM